MNNSTITGCATEAGNVHGGSSVGSKGITEIPGRVVGVVFGGMLVTGEEVVMLEDGGGVKVCVITIEVSGALVSEPVVIGAVGVSVLGGGVSVGIASVRTLSVTPWQPEAASKTAVRTASKKPLLERFG